MSEMLVAQRHEILLRELEAHGVLKIAELAARFGVSTATIRRDLSDLALAGKVTRVRGGAMLADRATVAARPDAESAGPVSAGVGPALGLLVPSVTYYYPPVVVGVRTIAARRRARIVIGLTDYARPRDLQQIEELIAGGAAGLLIASAGGHYLAPEVLDRLRSCGLPFVLIERQPEDPYEPCEYVISGHRQGAYEAVRHFRTLGHDGVAIFTNGSPTAPLLRDGHAAAVRQLRLDPSAPVVDSGRPTLGSADAAEHYERFIASCLATGTRAALVHSDHDAIELMRHLRSRGLRVPDDLAIIAYDDELAAFAEVPLTAVAPPKQELGEYGARLLLDRLNAAEPPAVRRLSLQPRLIIRDSCGASAPSRK